MQLLWKAGGEQDILCQELRTVPQLLLQAVDGLAAIGGLGASGENF